MLSAAGERRAASFTLADWRARDAGATLIGEKMHVAEDASTDVIRKVLKSQSTTVACAVSVALPRVISQPVVSWENRSRFCVWSTVLVDASLRQ